MAFKHYFFFLFVPLFYTAQTDSFIEAWKNDVLTKGASVGFYVAEAASSRRIAEYNAHQILIPASTLKVVSTSAALGILGADYRYTTRLYYRGKYDKNTGILDGDLIILGSGDPTLQSENFYSDKNKVTDKWAALLKEKGLKEIKGNIIGDASFFDRSVPSNWIWEDISNYFGAVPCGLSYRDNKFKVIYNTYESGSKAIIAAYYPSYNTHTLTLISDVTAKGSEDQAYAYGDPFSYIKEIRGTLPPNKTNYAIEVALPDPALLCAEDLLVSLKQVGIICTASTAKSNYTASENSLTQDLIYTHYSPALDKIIYYTNIKSNNLYCETLAKTLGKGETGKGLTAIKKYWQQRGLDTSSLFMEDASGLARINGMSPYFQTTLLAKIYRDSVNFHVFNISLPVAGKQGSMSNLGKGTRIENNMRAKTGYLTRVRAYCGYVKTKSGKDLAFSLIFNNYTCSAREAKLKIEKFLVALGEL